MNQTLHKLSQPLEELYARHNRRALVHPDPLEFLYEYDDPDDREIVGLLAASLAYGRVAQILRSVRWLLSRLGVRPRRFLEQTTPADLQDALATFKHRWTTSQEVVDLLGGIRRALERHGSLRQAFLANVQAGQETVQPALERFVSELQVGSCLPRNSLLPIVRAGGACKRMHLFLRWMVRCDDVDPGGWHEVPPAGLIVPLDTHMHRLGLALGLTRRRQADLRTALEITQAFRVICPQDPVRYDFALTRFGIRSELDEHEFLAQCKAIRGM